MLIKNLRDSREKLNLKQKDVAKSMGVDYSTYCGWETDKDIMSLKRLVQFANLYKCSLDYLLGFSEVNNYKIYIVVNYKTVGENLLRLRKKYNKTQSFITRELKISKGSYSNYENGKSLINIYSLYGLKRLYKDFSVDDLFK